MDREGSRRAERATLADPGMVTMSVDPPDGRKYWLDEDMLPKSRLGQTKPIFKIGEVAKVFFARSPDWLRWLGHQQADGGDTGSVLEVGRSESGSRIYTLVDVERITHTLLQQDRINMRQFIGAISVLRWMAYCYGILDEEDMKPASVEEQSGQQVIPLIDKEIEDALRRSAWCKSCQENDHQNCDTATEVAKAAWSGGSAKVEDPCPCFNADPAQHE